MPRWFIAILYTLMLVCAALPASSQALPDAAWAQGDEATKNTDEGERSTSLFEHLQADGPLEAPELFDGLRPPATDGLAITAPPGPAEALAPPPFLKGPQRPPRAPAFFA